MKIHIVKKGDTLFELSKKYNVPLQKLIDANPQIANPDQLNLGDKVKIPAAPMPVDGDGTNTYKHTVKEGDSLWKLAKAWGLPLQALVDANPQLGDPNVLSVGQVIHIPGKGSTITAESAGQANVIQQAPLVPGHGNKKSTAPITTGQGNKKNTAPIESPISTTPPPPPPAPQPAPAPVPAPAPKEVKEEKQEKLEKQEAMPIPIQEIGFEQIYYEPVKYENVQFENVQFENVKKESSPCPPIPEYPVLPSPLQYQVEQPTYVAPSTMYPSSPCGCSGHESKMENENLFYQYPIGAEKVSAHYDYPQYSQMQPFMASQPVTGEYPGISFAPSYQMPDNTGVGPMMQGYPTGPIMEQPMENMQLQPYPNEMYGGMHQIHHEKGWPVPYAPCPCCGSYPVYPHHHGMYSPHEMQGYGYPPFTQEPYAGFGVPGIPVQPTVPVAPIGGFGVSEPFMIDRDAEMTQSAEAAAGTATADRGENTKAEPKKEKAKKDVKVSGSIASSVSRKKRAGTTSTRNQVKKSKRNPWINK